MENKKNDEKKPGIWMCLLLVLVTLSVLIFMLSLLPSCTSTITMVHTEGTASDVVDEAATNTIKTSLEVPVQVLPK